MANPTVLRSNEHLPLYDGRHSNRQQGVKYTQRKATVVGTWTGETCGGSSCRAAYQKMDAHGSVWEVLFIRADPNGIRHCHVANASDRTTVKLISERSLISRKFYRLFIEPMPAMDNSNNLGEPSFETSKRRDL